jgi:hypothetical protein
MSFVSNLSGRNEVYVVPFDPAAAPGAAASTTPTQVSDQGGTGMVFWNRDGKELFYLAADRAVMSVAVEGTAPPSSESRACCSGRPPTSHRAWLRHDQSEPRRRALRASPCPRPQMRQLTMSTTGQGKPSERLGQPGSYVQPTMSPDGTAPSSCATIRSTWQPGHLGDRSGQRQRHGDHQRPSIRDNAPIWSPDGSSGLGPREKAAGIYRKRPTAPARRNCCSVHAGAGMVLTDCRPTGSS